MSLKIEYRDDDPRVAPEQEDVSELLELAVIYKTKTTDLNNTLETIKGIMSETMDKYGIRSMTTDKISIVWSPPSRQKRISRDKVIEVLTQHGIPVDAIEDCYEEYNRKEVITIKNR